MSGSMSCMTVLGRFEAADRRPAKVRNRRIGDSRRAEQNGPLTHAFRPSHESRLGVSNAPYPSLTERPGGGVQWPQSNILWAPFDNTESGLGSRQRHVVGYYRLGETF